MQYMLLIYGDEAAMQNFTKNDGTVPMGAEYTAYTKSIVASGNYKGGDALMPTSTATTVRVREGRTLTTDGPFAETREQLGGYYVVEAKDLDEAIALAARIPGAKSGSVEVRPLMVFAPR